MVFVKRKLILVGNVIPLGIFMYGGPLKDPWYSQEMTWSETVQLHYEDMVAGGAGVHAHLGPQLQQISFIWSWTFPSWSNSDHIIGDAVQAMQDVL